MQVKIALLGGEMSTFETRPSQIASANAAGDIINLDQKEIQGDGEDKNPWILIRET